MGGVLDDMTKSHRSYIAECSDVASASRSVLGR